VRRGGKAVKVLVLDRVVMGDDNDVITSKMVGERFAKTRCYDVRSS